MRARTFAMAVGAVSVGMMILIAPEVVGFTVMLLGAIALWRSSKRAGLRR